MRFGDELAKQPKAKGHARAVDNMNPIQLYVLGWVIYLEWCAQFDPVEQRVLQGGDIFSFRCGLVKSKAVSNTNVPQQHQAT